MEEMISKFFMLVSALSSALLRIVPHVFQMVLPHNGGFCNCCITKRALQNATNESNNGLVSRHIYIST
jgi:hypothetical protein